MKDANYETEYGIMLITFSAMLNYRLTT